MAPNTLYIILYHNNINGQNTTRRSRFDCTEVNRELANCADYNSNINCDGRGDYGFEYLGVAAAAALQGQRLRSRAVESFSEAGTVILQGFEQSVTPSEASTVALPGARAPSIPLYDLPTTAEEAGEKRASEAFENAKQVDVSQDTIDELNRMTGLTGNSQGKFDTAPVNIRSKPKPVGKDAVVAAGRAETIDAVYAKRVDDIFGQGEYLLNNFPVDPQKLNETRAAVERLFRIYEELLRTFPKSGDPSYGSLTVANYNFPNH